MRCKRCNLHIKNLTKYRQRFSEFCRCNADYPAKYHVELISAGCSRIYPWTNVDKCFNLKDSDAIRDTVRRCTKRTGYTFYVRRHLAGMEVTRLT